MRVRLTLSFDREYVKSIKGNKPLEKKVKKQIWLLENDIKRPSLRLHKLQNSQFWSVSVDMSVRMLFTIEDEFITVYHIGKHEDVY